MRLLAVGTLSLLCSICPIIQAARPTVVLASSNYPPYYGSNLPNSGGVVEIVVEAYRLAGYDVKVNFLPFPRALQEAKIGKYDGMIALWHRTEREQWFAFSAPLASNELGFYRRKGTSPLILSTDQLRHYRIGVVRGYATPIGFSAAALPGIEPVTHDIQNLKKLALGRIDLALIDKAQGAYLIKTQAKELDGIEWMEPAFQVDPMFLVLSKQRPGYEKRLNDFNNGLLQLAKTGKLDTIRIRHGL